MNYRGKDKLESNPYRSYRQQYRHDQYNQNDVAEDRPIVFEDDPIDWHFLVVLTGTWLAIIHYFERVVLHKAINKCRWEKWEKWPRGADPHRILLIADPQIVDRYTYSGIHGMFTWLIKSFTDNYARRNYEFLQGMLDPHSTIFLGDLFDGGREWDDAEWFEEYKRFNRIFKPRVNRRFINSIPGNHDIGYQTIEYDKVKRHAAHFGDLNMFVELGNHSIIMLDTISLQHPDPQIREPAQKFLDSVNDYLNPDFPRILLMHVPFYRFTHEQKCGPLREKGDPFPVQKGKQYQTVTEYHISQEVLEKLYPEIIFAGDDHDYCDILQTYPHNGGTKTSREIAVKSFAMNGGINQPAAQLLSLYNGGSSSETYKTEMCLMPLPYRPLKIYALVFFLSMAYLVARFIHPKKFISEIPRWTRQTYRRVGYKRFAIHAVYAFVFPILVLKVYHSLL